MAAMAGAAPAGEEAARRPPEAAIDARSRVEAAIAAEEAAAAAEAAATAAAAPRPPPAARAPKAKAAPRERGRGEKKEPPSFDEELDRVTLEEHGGPSVAALAALARAVRPTGRRPGGGAPPPNCWELLAAGDHKAESRTKAIEWLTRRFDQQGLRDEWLVAALCLFDRLLMVCRLASPLWQAGSLAVGLAVALSALKLGGAEAELERGMQEVVQTIARNRKAALWKTVVNSELRAMRALDYCVSAPTPLDVCARLAPEVASELRAAGFGAWAGVGVYRAPPGKSTAPQDPSAPTVQLLPSGPRFGVMAAYLCELALAHAPEEVYRATPMALTAALAALRVALEAFEAPAVEGGSAALRGAEALLIEDEAQRLRQLTAVVRALWAEPPAGSPVVRKWRSRTLRHGWCFPRLAPAPEIATPEAKAKKRAVVEGPETPEEVRQPEPRKARRLPGEGADKAAAAPAAPEVRSGGAAPARSIDAPKAAGEVATPADASRPTDAADASRPTAAAALGADAEASPDVASAAGAASAAEGQAAAVVDSAVAMVTVGAADVDEVAAADAAAEVVAVVGAGISQAADVPAVPAADVPAAPAVVESVVESSGVPEAAGGPKTSASAGLSAAELSQAAGDLAAIFSGSIPKGVAAAGAQSVLTPRSRDAAQLQASPRTCAMGQDDAGSTTVGESSLGGMSLRSSSSSSSPPVAFPTPAAADKPAEASAQWKSPVLPESLPDEMQAPDVAVPPPPRGVAPPRGHLLAIRRQDPVDPVAQRRKLVALACEDIVEHWDDLWQCLESEGWRMEMGKKGDTKQPYFLPHGVVRGPGSKKRVDYFDSKRAVLKHLGEVGAAEESPAPLPLTLPLAAPLPTAASSSSSSAAAVARARRPGGGAIGAGAATAPFRAEGQREVVRMRSRTSMGASAAAMEEPRRRRLLPCTLSSASDPSMERPRGAAAPGTDGDEAESASDAGMGSSAAAGASQRRSLGGLEPCPASSSACPGPRGGAALLGARLLEAAEDPARRSQATAEAIAALRLPMPSVPGRAVRGSAAAAPAPARWRRARSKRRIDSDGEGGEAEAQNAAGAEALDIKRTLKRRTRSKRRIDSDGEGDLEEAKRIRLAADADVVKRLAARSAQGRLLKRPASVACIEGSTEV